MVIGIMGAMPEEVDQLCARLSEVTVEEYGGVCYHRGSLAGRQAVVCCAGMGKANAAATTQVLITKYGAEKIIFSGVAGNMTSKIGIGDVVIGQTVLYHDADMDMLNQNPPYLDEYPVGPRPDRRRPGSLRPGGGQGHRGGGSPPATASWGHRDQAEDRSRLPPRLRRDGGGLPSARSRPRTGCPASSCGP